MINLLVVGTYVGSYGVGSHGRYWHTLRVQLGVAAVRRLPCGWTYMEERAPMVARKAGSATTRAGGGADEDAPLLI